MAECRYSPQQIIELIRSGDPAVLNDLVACYGRRLLAVGRKHCHDGDVEDAVQEALYSAGQHLQRFRGDGSPEGWMVRMVINACRRMKRGRKNDPCLHTNLEDVQEAILPEASQELDAMRQQLARALDDAMEALSPTDRVLLLLADSADWTTPELAEEFDMKAGVVRTRLSRMRKKMRDVLQAVAHEWDIGESAPTTDRAPLSQEAR